MVFSNTYYFVSAWFLLHVYVLVDVLDFVVVLYQSGVFEYISLCVLIVVATRVCFGSRSRLRFRVVSEWCFQIHVALQWLGGGAVVCMCKTYLCTPKKLLQGAKNEVARDVWEIQRFPSRLLSSMVKCIFILEDKYAITSLDNYGL